MTIRFSPCIHVFDRDDEVISFEYDGAIPRAGEEVEVSAGVYLVESVSWRIKPHPLPPSIQLFCKRLRDSYDQPGCALIGGPNDKLWVESNKP